MGALDGRCFCGQSSFACEGPALKVVHCQCTDCQKLSGTGHKTNVVVKKGSVTVHGPVSTHAQKADSGNVNTRTFCTVCGTQLFRENSGMPDVDIIHAGTLDNPNAVTPAAVIWHRSAPGWDYTDPALAVFDKMPPA